jgi:hypothetical protein
MTEADRRHFACPPATGEINGIDLALLDPDGEDERRILIETEHPELLKALEDDSDVHAGTEVMNPRLHIAMHEIVANQLWADDPPEVWRTARRLLQAGYERHDVLHMLGSVMSGEIWKTLHDKAPFDAERMRRELAALPASWEAMRDNWPAERARNRAERRATERQRHPRP